MFVRGDIAPVLEATVRFANLRRIRSTREVEDLFRDLPIIKQYFKELQAGEEAAYRKNQSKLKEWLRAIAEGKGNTIAEDVSALLGIIPAVVSFDRGARELAFRWRVEGVRDSYALGVAALLARSLKLTKRLGYCDAPGCGRFRLDLTSRGRPWRYCNSAHRMEADKMKQKRRAADRRAKAKRKAPRRAESASE
jgi:hypothetical protein